MTTETVEILLVIAAVLAVPMFIWIMIDELRVSVWAKFGFVEYVVVAVVAVFVFFALGVWL